MAPTRQEILAASAGWVAVTLNVLPGLGAGYLYQRRWKAYWVTSALANYLVRPRGGSGARRRGCKGAVEPARRAGWPYCTDSRHCGRGRASSEESGRSQDKWHGKIEIPCYDLN